MSIFLRKLWQNKPRQWGPVSRVQASLFHNADSIYGIDPNSFFAALPGWDSYNYAKEDRLPNHGAAFEKNTLTFDDADISIPPFPYLACSVAFLGCTLANITTWQYLWHSCCDLISTDAIYGIKFQFIIDTGELAISYFDGGKAGPDHRRSKIGGSATTAKANYAGVINGYNDMDLYVNGSDIGGTYSGNATTYNAGPYWGAFGAATSQQTINYGHFSVGTILVAKAAWLPSQIAALSDNPYGLWQRVAPVTYFVPGGSITLKNIVDTGIGSDVISQISNALSVSDAGSGADTFSGLGASLSLSDTGSGVDTIPSINASMIVSDTGSAVDTVVQILSSLLVSDTASAVDTVAQILSAIAVLDTGSGVDIANILSAALKTITDTGAGTDIVIADASLSVEDSGSGTDIISQLLATLLVQDSGSGVENISVLTDILKTVMDNGTGTDSIGSPTVSLSISDSAGAVDIVSLSAALSVLDIGSASDLVNAIKTKMIQIQDTGAGSDAVTVAVAVTLDDIATATDVIGQVLTSLNVLDSGTGTDSVVATDVDLLANGKVKVSFSIKIPGISFDMKIPGIDFDMK